MPTVDQCGRATNKLRTRLDQLRSSSPRLFNITRSVYYEAAGFISFIRGVFKRGAQWRRYYDVYPIRKLHVGCGPNLIPGWFNTDRGALHGDVSYLNASARFPFKDQTFGYVFSEHMIEHIPFRDGVAFVSECFRVLKPGGKLRISTPDLAKIMLLESDHLPELERDYVNHVLEQIPEAIGSHPAYVINLFVRAWGHTFIYDKSVLTEVFQYCGFSDVRVCAPGESDDAELRGLERHGTIYPRPEFNLVESIVLEATKPSV